MNSNTRSLLILSGTLLVLGVLAIGVFTVPYVKRAQETAMQTKEVARVRHLAMVVMSYSSDHGGTLPGATWRTDCAPYLVGGTSTDGFALNRHVAGKSIAKLPGDVVLLFEADPGVAFGDVGDLPLAPRFKDRFVGAHLDGSVRTHPDPKKLNWSSSP